MRWPGGRPVYNAAVMDSRTAVIAPIALILVSLFVACGSSDDGAASAGGDAAAAAPEAEIDPVEILRPGSTFTVDDVAAAGWKKSRELAAETLPNATSVWYGFYNQRDVEVRVYPSHESAVSDGTGPADVATGRGGKPAPFAVGGISATRTSYGAYAIVGNLVLLCEVQTDDCAGLFDALQ